MKKTLSVLAVLGIVAIGAQSAQAAWYDSNWNPSNWFGRGCNKWEKKCDPCTTGAAAPCNPCNVQPKVQPCNPCPIKQAQPCDPCDKLQNMNK